MTLKNILTLWAACMAFVMTACNNDPAVDNPTTGNEGSEVVVKDVKVLTTTGSRSRDLNVSYLEFGKKDNMSPSTIWLKPQTEYQTMEGFGVAITGSSCYNLMKMPQAERKALLKKTFSPTEGFGFSYVRISIGCSDFSLSEFTCCDKPGIENFALTSEDTEYVIPILKEILSYNPSLKIMGSPWTAPLWMKVDNLSSLNPMASWTSGQLNPAYYDDYAQYFVNWVKAFEDQGIKITSVTLQNEPLNRGNSASMFMPWDQQAEFIKVIGPKFKGAGLDTKIYAFDHNYNYDNMSDQQGYPMKIYADAEASKYLAGAAYHNYGGNKDELNNAHNAAPNKELIFSETSIGTWNDGRNLEKRLIDDMREVALGTVNRWCTGVLVWNFMLDTNGKPYRPGGCSTCYGALDISTDYKTVTRNSHYYIIAHMASVVAPGAKRIGTTGFNAPGVEYAAFANPDGTYALVAYNSNNNSVKFTVDDGTHHFTCEMPGNSVVSYKW